MRESVGSFYLQEHRCEGPRSRDWNDQDRNARSEVREQGDPSLNGFVALQADFDSKGSIMIRFVLEDSSLCFINSHLASGQTHPIERTRDIIEILEQKSHFPVPNPSTRLAYVGMGDGSQVADHELTFFAGEPISHLLPLAQICISIHNR